MILDGIVGNRFMWCLPLSQSKFFNANARVFRQSFYRYAYFLSMVKRYTGGVYVLQRYSAGRSTAVNHSFDKAINNQ